MMKIPTLTTALLLAVTIAANANTLRGSADFVQKATTLEGLELDQKDRDLQVAQSCVGACFFEAFEGERLDEPAPGVLRFVTNFQVLLNQNPSDLVVISFAEIGDFQGRLRVNRDGSFRYDPPGIEDGFFSRSVFFQYCVRQPSTLVETCEQIEIFVRRDPDRPLCNPRAFNVNYDVDEGEKLSVPGDDQDFLVRGVDECSGPPLTTDCGGGGSGSNSFENSFDIDTDGSFEYRADRCDIRSECFQYRACHEGFEDMVSNEATVCVRVRESPGRPDSPEARDDDEEIMEQPRNGDPVRFCVLGNDDCVDCEIADFDDDLDDLGGPDDDGCFEYFARSGQRGPRSFTYTVQNRDWECAGTNTATVRIDVTPNPDKPGPPTSRGQSIQARSGQRSRGNVFLDLEFNNRFNLVVTDHEDPSSGTLRIDEKGNFEFGNAPVGQTSFRYTACYYEWGDVCGTFTYDLETTEAGKPSSSRQGISTYYEISWSGVSAGGCATIQPSPTIRCNGGQLIVNHDVDPTDSNAGCWIGTTGDLHCPAANSGVVHVQCWDSTGRNPHHRQVVAALGSAGVACTGGSASHSMEVNAYCNEKYVPYDINYCSGTKLTRNGGVNLCSQEATAVARSSSTIQVDDFTLTSSFDNTCIVTQNAPIPGGGVQELRYVGNGDDIVPPLLECQGDCDEDSDCAGNFICFQRDEEVVPGCRAGTEGAREDTDYCTRSSASRTGEISMEFVADDRSDAEPFYPLEECQGDCDDDDECDPGLYCYQRDGSEAIPGCKDDSPDFEDKDFCSRVPSP